MQERPLDDRSREDEDNLFHLLTKDAPVAMSLSYGRECVVRFANEKMFEIWGKPAEDVLGKPVFESMPEARGQGFEEIINQIFDTGESYKANEVLIHLKRNGVLVPVYLNLVYQPVKKKDGVVIGIQQVALDVTELVTSRKLIEESEAQLKLLRDTVPAMIFYLDTGERYRSYNNIFMNWFSVDDTEALGKTVQEFIGDKAYESAKPYLVRAYKGERVEYHMRAPQKIGRDKWLNIAYTPHINAENKVLGIITHATDITEHIVSRQLIEQKELEWRNLISTSHIGICVLNAPDSKIEEVNEQFIHIAGKKKEDFINATYWDVFPEVADAFAPVLEDVFKTGIKFTTAEMKLILIRNGVPETIYATFEYIPFFNSEKAVVKVIVMVIEVTHQAETRKKIEESVLERTAELNASNLNLKRSNEELEQFAYIASHDLQEPVRKISTFTQLLEMSLKEIEPKSKDYIRKIYNSTDRMTQLIRDVLAFSRIRDEEGTFEKVDLNDVVNLVINDYELRIADSGAIVEVKNLPVLMAIPTQMNQLFGNLLSNALKFRRPDIKPVIKVTCDIAEKKDIAKHLALDVKKKYYKIEFTDNGIGFEKEYIDKIFRIFQRLHGKSEFEGTGIGLAICRKIVQKHQGHISAEAGKNGGAVFRIILPEILIDNEKRFL